MGLRVTWFRGHLQCARMATTPLTPTHVHPTATMDQAGSRVEFLLASGRGVGVDAAFTGAGALADADTTEAGRPFPGAEAFAVESVTGTPVAAHVLTVGVDVPTTEAGVASVEVDVPTAEADVALVEADVPTAEAGVASVEADMPTAEADAALVVADMPSAEAGMAVAEAVMVVGAGRFHHQLATLAADGICCRPLRFKECRRFGINGKSPDRTELILATRSSK